MATDKLDVLGPLFADVGAEVAAIVSRDPEGAFLYAEAGEGWIGAAIFLEDGDIVRYYDPSLELCDLLIAAWETEDADKRWSVMQYAIQDRKFKVAFDFPEDLKPGEFVEERRERALEKRYGRKEVIYPPMTTTDD